MKRLLLVFLILSSNLFAEQGETILKVPQLIIPQCGEDEPYNLVDVERAIAEFEAQLAQELAEKAAQEMMAEIEAEAEAKLSKLQPTVCERTGGYEAYILEIKKNYP